MNDVRTEGSAGSAEHGWRGDRVMWTTFRGRITTALSERARIDAFRLVGERTPEFWVIDVSDMNGFEAGVRAAGARWMREFRAGGGREMVVVLRSPAVRMMATALGFAASLPVKVVATANEAIEHLGL